jgi:cytochrome b subunit of formate dehydrogenase
MRLPMFTIRPVLCLLFVLPLPPVALPQTAAACLSCHSDRDLSTTRNGQAISLFVDETQFKESIHGTLNCTECHVGLNPDEIPHAKTIPPIACGNCHDDETARYARSAHGRALAAGAQAAPRCGDCHGRHDIQPMSVPQSRVSKRNQPRACLQCHVSNLDVIRRVGVAAGFVAAYETSIHGVLVTAGNEKAATCSDCHTGHGVEKASNPESAVNKANIPATCGKCHEAISKTYGESIHGTALKAGNRDAPACTDCHGEHQIYAPQNPLSKVSPANVSARVCGVCHGSVALTQKYGLAAERFRTFEDSYHGLASREGSVQVANCASCHGYHDIKPASNPTSRVNKANLSATCGQCHPGAGENFAVGPVHVQLAPTGNQAILYWIRWVYIGLIFAVVGGMLVHNGFDFVGKSKLQLARRRGEIPRPHIVGGQYLRMTVSERLQHAALLISFTALVITGFMLKYPDAFWVGPVRSWTPGFFSVRGVVHRAAAVVLIAASLYHLFYVVFTRRGRQLVRDLFPTLQDVREARGMMAYYLGLSKSRPLLDRFSYVEKLEYWALVWGTVVMTATGIILWFNTFFVNRLTKLGWDAAESIHYYEAWLATLAIIVWHFYFVIFNPDAYPMNTAKWDGMLTEEQMEDEHPRELERIRAMDLQPLDRPEPEEPEA